ncbi:hypothetical protein ACFL5T_03635 [Gemmatimonadota bacterium]
MHTEYALEQLVRDAADEETEIWVSAARQIGGRAATEPAAREVIQHWASREGKSNVHRYRHGMCAAATLMSVQPEAVPSSVYEQVCEDVVRPVGRILFESGTWASVEDLPTASALRDLFEQWKSRSLKAAAERLTKLNDNRKIPPDRIEDARASINTEIELLESLSGGSVVPRKFYAKLPKGDPWVLASYLAGVTSTAGLLGVPLDALVEAIGRKVSDGGSLPLVLALPGLVKRLSEDLSTEQVESCKVILEEAHSPAWVDSPEHLVTFLHVLSWLTDDKDPLSRWVERYDLPSEVSRLLVSGIAEEGVDRSRALLRLSRNISGNFFSTDWSWRELGLSEKAVLGVFVHALLEARPAGNISQRHRTAILLDAIDTAREAPETVMPSLVRTLKRILYEDLQEAGSRLPTVCREQAAIIGHLTVTLQQVRTIQKDVATMVVRVLEAAWASKDRTLLVDCLYQMSQGVFTPGLVRVATEYCRDSDLHRLLDVMASVLDPTSRSGQQALECYEDYHTMLVGGSDVAVSHWVRSTPRLVRMLGRVDSTDRETHDVALLSAVEELLRRDWAAERGTRVSSGEIGDDEHLSVVRGRFALDALLADIDVLEASLPEGKNEYQSSAELVQDWRSLLARTHELMEWTVQHLPAMERTTCVHLLNERHQRLEERLSLLAGVLGGQDEEAAVQLAQSVSEAGEESDRGEVATVADRDLIRAWMLKRYMLRELAAVDGARFGALLLSPGFVAGLIAAPFVVSAVSWRIWGSNSAWPFLAAVAVGLVILVAFVWESGSILRRRHGTGFHPIRLLLPQTTAALFVGLQGTISADETWSLAVLGNPSVRVVMVLAFLGVGYLFTREVLLGDQRVPSARPALRHTKRRRAMDLMAVTLWQSFTLVSVFAILTSPVMSGGGRADIGSGAATTLFLVPGELSAGPFRVFPWAIAIWTVQVFFFSAIFERIMQKD